MASQKRSSSSFWLTFSRLNHQGSGNRERYRRGVETVVHQPLGNVFHLYAGPFEGTAVNDHFVRTAAFGAYVQHRIMVFEPRALM